MKKIYIALVGLMVMISAVQVAFAQQQSPPTRLEAFRFVLADDEDVLVNANLQNQQPDPAEPGESLELRWKVMKEGLGDLSNLTFRLDPDYPFSLAPGQAAIQRVGTWPGFAEDEEYYTLFYKLRVAENPVDEEYSLELQSRNKNDGAWKTREFDIRVDEARRPNLVLGTMTTSPQRLQADIDEAQLNLEVHNIGDEGIENARMQLELPDGVTPSYSYSDRAVLGSIPAGSFKTAKFYVDIEEDIPGGVYPVGSSLRYQEKGDDDSAEEEIITNLPFNMTLKNTPRFKVHNFSVSPTPRPGDSVTARFVVENIGKEKGESVSVRAFKDSTQPFEFDEKTDYIGTLEPGDTGEGTLTLDIDNDASAKEYLIDLEIRAIDGKEVIVKEKQSRFEIMPPAQESGFGVSLPVIAIAAVVIVGGIAYYLGKRIG